MFNTKDKVHVIKSYGINYRHMPHKNTRSIDVDTLMHIFLLDSEKDKG